MLGNQTLWTLDARGVRWTQERLISVAELLLNIHTMDPVLLNRLRDDLGLPDLQARPVHLDDFSTNGWATRSLAVALYLQQVFMVSRGTPPAVSSVALDQLHEELRQQLVLSLTELKTRIHPQAMEIAAQYPDAFGLIYNYLRQSQTPLYWHQFAHAYPIFLRAVIMRDAPWPLQKLVDLVNDGQPLKEELVQILGVTPATLRCLVGIPVNIIGHRWLTQLDTLVELLDQLRPECRPRTDEGWQIFNDLVDFLENRVGQPIRRSFYVRAWLREILHTPRERAQLERNIQERHATVVNSLFGDCLAVIAHELGLLGLTRTVRLPQTVRATVVGWILQFKPNRLFQIGLEYQEHQLSHRREGERLMATALGERYWPLIPEDFISLDRSRRITPLINAHQLKKHGDTMRICLGNLPQYHIDCKKGHAFIVALLDAQDHPLSTAELRVQDTAPGPKDPIRLRVVQHTAHANTAIQHECRLAMLNLLEKVQTDAIQKHLRLGLLAQRAYREGQASFSMSQVEAHTKGGAMRRIFGEARMDDLIAKCRTALEKKLTPQRFRQ